jgi:hypothetical protein
MKPPDHWQQFHDFCYLDKKAGGPDPHMVCTGQIAKQRGLGQAESAWLGACYVSVYNVPTALVINRRFPTAGSALDRMEVEAWLLDNWAGITFRRERKAVRSVEKLARCLSSAASYCLDVEGRLAAWMSAPTSASQYEAAYADVCGGVYGWGRYNGQKWIEYGRRYCDFPVRVHDVRAKDGWSPRHALGLLYPEHRPLLEDGGDGPDAVREVEALAADARDTLAVVYGLELDFFELQVLLCDYKQCWVGRRQYPGRSQDSELDYVSKIAPHWGRDVFAEQFAARRVVAPRWALGELNGWEGVRKPLGAVLRDHGYTWSDSLYLWSASAANLNSPAPR